jgi:hypothetical protein
MVRVYVRKTTRQQWGEAAMNKALADIRSGTMGTLKASKVYGVARSTIQRRLHDSNKFALGSTKVLGGLRNTLSPAMETELVKYLVTMESMFYGLTRMDLRRLAYQLAEKNNLNHGFNREKKAAGEDWLRGFLLRHPTLSVRQPEATSQARAMAFNKPNVAKFFDSLQKLLEEHKFSASRIFNVDETGLTTVQRTSSKIIALRGRRQVGSRTSAERGQLYTTVICMNAAGSFIPPLIIFPRKRMKIELMDGTPPDSIFACHESGWMQTDIFQKWFEHFLAHTSASVNNPALLIMDGHGTHTNNIELIDMARTNGVTLLCIPPHCSHKLQPLDIAFMKPLKTFYDQECERWLRQHPGRTITMFQTGAIFGTAYLKAATQVVGVNGFRKTGIYPFNRDIFEEYEFSAAAVTDNPQASPKIVSTEFSAAAVTDNPQASPEIVSTEFSAAAVTDNPQASPEIVSTDSVPEPSSGLPVDVSVISDRPAACDLLATLSTPSILGPFVISPIPKSTAQPRKRKAAASKSLLITSSPYKQQLVERKAKKTVADSKKSKTKAAANSEAASSTSKDAESIKALNKLKRVSARPIIDSSTDDGSASEAGLCDDNSNDELDVACSSNQTSERRIAAADRKDANDNCVICGEFGRGGEVWYRCVMCSFWAHKLCSGADRAEGYICDYCT